MIDDASLRHAIRDMVEAAVANEVAQQVAPLRQQSQIHGGQLSQLNRDYGALREQVQRHDQVIIGDEKIGMGGLVKQVAVLGVAIEALESRITTWTAEMNGFRKALYIVGGIVGATGVSNIAQLFGMRP